MIYFRPTVESERAARALVRLQFPLATSAYVADGAVVYDPVSGQELGRAGTGDWVVERA